MKKTFIFLQIVLICCVVSCNKNTGKETAKKIITEWTGKIIQFPDSISYVSLGKDTVSVKQHQSPYTILLYTDSTGCTACKLQMYKWDILIDEVNKEMDGKVDFFFCFHPKNKKELEHILKRDGFSYPVFIDEKDTMNKLNNFPENNVYQCFLLDKNNVVVGIGNPTQNPKIWKLYKDIITQGNSFK